MITYKFIWTQKSRWRVILVDGQMVTIEAWPMSNTIDFAAARARLLRRVALRNTYVDVSFDLAELEPVVVRPLLADMLLDVARDCGGDVRAIASDLRLGK